MYASTVERELTGRNVMQNGLIHVGRRVELDLMLMLHLLPGDGGRSRD